MNKTTYIAECDKLGYSLKQVHIIIYDINNETRDWNLDLTIFDPFYTRETFDIVNANCQVDLTTFSCRLASGKHLIL